MAAREKAVVAYRLLPTTVWAPPEDAIVTLVLSLLHASHMLEFARSLRCAMNLTVLCGGGGQGQVPQSPLLDEILGLVRNDSWVHQGVGE